MVLPRKVLICLGGVGALIFICFIGACQSSTSGVIPTAEPRSAIVEEITATSTRTSELSDTPEPTVTHTETVSPTPSIKLVVHFIDVGQGDSILIQAPDGSSILIDGGEAGSGALSYLQRQKISKLDLIILTHPDSDHLGGIVEILNTLKVTKVITNGQSHTTTLYENFLDAIAKATAEYSEVKRGVSLKYGELVLNFLNPLSIRDGNLNNNSLVFRLEYGKVSFMFTGDLQSDGETQLLSSKLPLSSTILKVAHHGSKSGSIPAFLEAVHPSVAVYTAGLGNPSGNPSPDTLASLAAIGVNIFGTDQNGTIIVTTDGTDYSVETEKQPTKSGPIIPVAPKTTDTPIPTKANTSAPTITESPKLSLSIASLTSPIAPGGTAKLTALTNPGANCTITVMLKSGASQASGLGPQKAGLDGACSWSWKIGSNTTVGIWKIIVQASMNGQSISKEVPFEVKK